MASGNGGEHAGRISMWLDVVQLTGLSDGREDCPVLYTIADRWRFERVLFEPFVRHDQSCAKPAHQLQPINALRAEQVDRTVKRLFVQMTLDESGQTIVPFAEIYWFGSYIDVHTM